ncbi:hypothetical protein [Paenibacillus chitinolyticus]|uniref:hypothetical protein n=1 Tax=Paenibacillus chitinolyticus TaxID=79263 RepID=UPI001C469FC2|nr:hypothetical protein [Paenibacillus chitinolyticus]MBV6713064.1 hypothetical protein [Paenibacillus chitinolyticus]
MNNPINDVFDALTPTEGQKAKMWNAISAQKNIQPIRSRSPIRRRLLASLTACFLMVVVSATAYAATDGKVISIIKNQMNKIFFASGSSIMLQINDDGGSVGTDGIKGEWLVKESSFGRLVLTVNGEDMNITDTLLEKGYFYYDYRDDAGILHRVYIVKNAGGTKDYAERWYSQYEWLPELGVGGGSRGTSGPLSRAIMLAEVGVKEGTGDLDTMLQQELDKYWAR